MTTTDETIAFVAGATGYTGRSVVEQLRQRAVRTIAHVRPDSKSLAEWRTRFEALGAELDTTAWEQDAMTATFARLRPTLVFALLGTTRKRAAQAKREGRDVEAESYDHVDYGMSVMLIGAAKSAGARPRYVYLSAAGVPESPTGNAYYDARSRVERELKESGLPFTIARPSIITGDDRDENRPGEQIGANFLDAAMSVAAAFGATKLRDRYHSIDGKTLAAALVTVALDASFEGKTVDGETLRSVIHEAARPA